MDGTRAEWNFGWFALRPLGISAVCRSAELRVQYALRALSDIGPYPPRLLQRGLGFPSLCQAKHMWSIPSASARITLKWDSTRGEHSGIAGRAESRLAYTQAAWDIGCFAGGMGFRSGQTGPES